MFRILDAVRSHGLVAKVRPWLPPLNFITIHYLYFIVTTLIASVVFYCISTPAWSIPYADSLFHQISAMSGAGLNTYNLSQMNTAQQWMLWMQMIMGSAIFVSISVLHVRKSAFNEKFGALVKAQRESRRERRGSHLDAERLHSSQPTVIQEDTAIQMATGLRDGNHEKVTSEAGSNTTPEESLDTNKTLEGTPSQQLNILELNTSNEDHISFIPGDQSNAGTANKPNYKPRRPQLFSFTGVGASPVNSTSFRRPGAANMTLRNTSTDVRKERASTEHHSLHAFLTKDVVGRNSQFHDLTEEEREKLGGVEYRAISLLSWIVPVYFILFQLLGCLGLGAWMRYNAADVSETNGVNPWWNGAFNAVSAFNNSGMSLIDANMIPFQTSTYPVMTMGFLILAGNTAYPVFLRLIIWTMLRLLPTNHRFEDTRETLTFVLKHPRRVYTSLFPSRPTWWLLMTLVVLNGTDWLLFEVLNIGNPAVEAIPTGSRMLDGLFQALAVRSGGFYIIPIPSLRVGVQVLYVVMMYISVYPVAMTTRNSNVYEERSLGIYAEDAESSKSEDPEINQGKLSRLRRTMTGRAPSETRSYFLRQQIRGQLEHDLSWLVVAIFVITCIEASNFERDPVTYSVFNIIFEVVSGYGCVGITQGLPDQAYSFCGGWHTASKLVLCAVMLRGRHRGLPVALDRAVLLPGEGERRGKKEEEDHALRRGRSLEN
jgi:Trk-type K+ transport system membrane component